MSHNIVVWVVLGVGNVTSGGGIGNIVRQDALLLAF